MKLFSVMDPVVSKRINVPSNLKANMLFQFNNQSYVLFKNYPNINILIDSAAYYYNFHHEKGDMKWKRNLSKYLNFINNTKNDQRILGYFELDYLFLGRRKIEKMREQLFEISPKIIPIYHANYPIKVFRKMVKKYDYVGLPLSKDTLLNQDNSKYLIKYAFEHDCKLHALGMNKIHEARKLPFYSCDSAVWMTNGMMDYYTTDLEKNVVNNKKIRPLFEENSFKNHLIRQKRFESFWSYDFCE